MTVALVPGVLHHGRRVNANEYAAWDGTALRGPALAFVCRKSSEWAYCLTWNTVRFLSTPADGTSPVQ